MELVGRDLDALFGITSALAAPGRMGPGWHVVNDYDPDGVDPMEWKIGHSSLDMLRGEGDPFKLEITRKKDEEDGDAAKWWVMAHNRVKGFEETRFIARLRGWPQQWDRNSFVPQAAEWFEEQKDKILDAVGTPPDAQGPPVPPPGAAAGGMAPGGMFASRIATRLTSDKAWVGV